MGHTQPPALHRAGPASLPLPWPHVLPPGGEALLAGLGAHSARAAVHRDPPQRTRWLRGGGGLNQSGASHPADTPACSTQVCVFFLVRGREGRRHVALGPALAWPGTGMQEDGVSPPGPPPLTLAAPRPYSQLGLEPRVPTRPRASALPTPRPGPRRSPLEELDLGSSGPERGLRAASWPSVLVGLPPATLRPAQPLGCEGPALPGTGGRPPAGTHPVKTRHSRVQKRMRTWLNMADCERRMARWKSFCGAGRGAQPGRDGAQGPSRRRSRTHTGEREGEGLRPASALPLPPRIGQRP